MTEENRSSYLDAIVRDRSADGPRLDYATFLERKGAADMAGFIRAQIEAVNAPTNRRDGLKAQTESMLRQMVFDYTGNNRVASEAWLYWAAYPEESGTVTSYLLHPSAKRPRLVYDRGLPATLVIDLEEADKTRRIAMTTFKTIGNLAIITSPHQTRERLATLAEDVPLDHITSIAVSDPEHAQDRYQFQPVDLARTLAAAPFMAVTTLAVPQQFLGDEGIALLAQGRFRSVLRLNLDFSEMTAAGLGTLARSRPFSGVIELSLSGNKIGDGGAEAILASPLREALVKLNVGQTGISPDSAVALAEGLPNLTSFEYRGQGYAIPAAVDARIQKALAPRQTAVARPGRT